MVICKEVLEREIENSKKMIEGNLEAISVHTIVLKAFEAELVTLNQAEEIAGELLD